MTNEPTPELQKLARMLVDISSRLATMEAVDHATGGADVQRLADFRAQIADLSDLYLELRRQGVS